MWNGAVLAGKRGKRITLRYKRAAEHLQAEGPLLATVESQLQAGKPGSLPDQPERELVRPYSSTRAARAGPSIGPESAREGGPGKERADVAFEDAMERAEGGRRP